MGIQKKISKEQEIVVQGRHSRTNNEHEEKGRIVRQKATGKEKTSGIKGIEKSKPTLKDEDVKVWKFVNRVRSDKTCKRSHKIP